MQDLEKQRKKMINLYGLPLNKLEEQMLSEGQNKFRAKQLYSWIYEKHVTNFDEMTDISKSFRDVLKEKYCLEKPSVFIKQVSKDGTIKLLLELKDGSKVETVLMRYDYGNVICVTSQVGCAMGCSFCASGLLKKQRDLTAAEMVGELVVVDDMLREEGTRVTHIVVMGTGEPFDNYDNVMDFVRVANEQKGFAIGARHITVSTCGLVPRIYDYANEGLQINLAISLHAPNNELRSKIMKINKAYPLEVLIPAIVEYNKKNKTNYDVIVVNDGSKDRTEEILTENNINHIKLIQNLGIGGAVQTGYKYAFYNNYDVAIQFDGDGQHDEKYIDKLINEIEKGNDFVIGSRFIGSLSKFKSSGTRRIGIKTISLLIKICTGVKIYDPTSGFRAANKDVIKLFSSNYPTEYPEPESSVNLIRKRYKIKEIPVEMHERQFGISSIKPLKSIYYMFSVCIAIIITGIWKEGKK